MAQQEVVKNPEKLYKAKKKIDTGKIWKKAAPFAAIGVTLILAFFDYQAIFNLFMGPVSKEEAITYAVLYAICLEGIPFFGAGFAATMLVKIAYKKNAKKHASVGFWISIVGILAAFVLVWYLRDVQIDLMGGKDAYLTLMEVKPGEMESSYPEYITDTFLRISPMLTSALAFLASWTVQQKDTEEELEIEVKRAYDEYLYREALFMEVWQKLQNEREALWSSITQYESSDMEDGVKTRVLLPEDTDCFREECYRRFRACLISKCTKLYPEQIQIYQTMVEVKLGECLLEMSEHSTIPDVIEAIKPADVIEEHDKRVIAEGKKMEECWGYSKASKALETNFKALIDNSTVVAQGYVTGR